jgi:hypothetical protein
MVVVPDRQATHIPWRKGSLEPILGLLRKFKNSGSADYTDGAATKRGILQRLHHRTVFA